MSNLKLTTIQERRAACQKKYYNSHKTKLSAYGKQYYARHKTELTAYGKKYYIDHKVDNQEYHLRRTFGIALDEYNQVFAKQEGKCAICGRYQSEFKRAFDVDHNHETGTVRGLLCSKCNMGIGYFNDDVTLLSDAIQYLKE
jgi:hypothetical protein